LLRGLRLAGEDNIETLALLTGYEAPAYRLELKMPPLPPDGDGKSTRKELSDPLPPVTDKPIRYYRVLERKPSDILPETGTLGVDLPDWYDEIQPLDESDTKAIDTLPPDKEALIPWARLWPVVQALLSQLKRTRQPDIPKLVRTIANGDIPIRIPRRIRQQWAASVQVLVDRPERTELFNEDYNQLLEQLQQLRGTTGFKVQRVLERPGTVVRIRQADTYQHCHWHLPEGGTQIFILSDLGLLDQSGRALQDWLQFGRRLQAAGFRPLVLIPLPIRYLTPELIAVFDCVCWSRQGDLRIVRWVASMRQQDKDRQGAKDLLAWLSPAARVEPALLRAVRHRLPALHYDVGTEAAAWLHEDVEPTSIGFYFRHNNIEAHRRRFRELAIQQPALANTIVRVLREYHAHVFPTQLHEEMLILADLLDEESLNDIKTAYKDDIARANQHWKRLLKALNEKAEGTHGLPAFAGHCFKRQHRDMWQSWYSQHLPAMWGVLMREYYASLPERLPDFFDDSSEAKRLALAFMNKAGVELCDYVLFQRGVNNLRGGTRQSYEQGEEGFRTGTPLAEFRVRSQFALNQRQHADGKQENLLLPLNNQDIHDFQFREKERQQIHIAGEVLTIEGFIKLGWEWLIAHDYEKDNALYAEVVNDQGEVFRWYWNPPSASYFMEQDVKTNARNQERLSYRGLWYSEYIDDIYSLKCPEWANTVGWNQFGLYADVEIFDIIQRFRWIEPTSFLMGSPENEKGRYDNEVQHSVILTQGYWLADTACTQALWEAVMHDNPSHFKGESLPVENVSWNGIQGFIEKLNQYNSELKLRLPTEAEWENACRAGTTEAFNLKGELSLDNVNYRGTWDYKSNEWGDGALKQTVDVKSEKYQPNAWGLHQMHGNVWEWCQDWYADYPTESAVNPQEPDSGSRRVLRGGSWVNGGRYCRSAYRSRFDPSNRIHNVGFRLARGHELSAVRTVKAGQQPAGSRERSGARGGQTGDGLRAPDSTQKPNKSTGKKQKNLLNRAKGLFKK